MVVIEKASSLSSLSSTRKTEKVRSYENDTHSHEVVKGKSVKRANSFSSIKKEKQVTSPKHGQERLKSKLMPRASSFSSLSPPLKKEKLVRGGSSLSTSNVESPKRARKSTEIRKSSSMKSKIKELGLICKKRKEILSSVQVQDEFEVCFDKQINEGTMINPDDCFWLSSGSMSPQEFGLFMSALDPCLDEWVISFVPRSSNSPTAVKNEIVTSEETLVQEPVEVIEEILDPSDPSSSSSLALSTYTNNSGFWNMDRTGVWVSLINLEGEDSKLISDEISEDEELDSNFPSPTHQETNWDAYSSDVGISSSARSTQESSHSDWSSDLLSDSLDWDLDSEDPIFWPFGLESGWNPNLESFSVSPRKGAYKTSPGSENDGVDGVVSPNSIKFRLHASREGSKDGFKKKILFVSGLSASKIIEFKKGYRKKIASSRRSQIGKRVGRFKRRVPPILETDLEGISPKETPTKETQDLVGFGSDIMSGSEDWADEMDSDGPLVWPNDQRNDWNVTCDFLNISPRKNVVNITNSGSPKGGFTVSGSIRLKFRPNKKSKTKSSYTLPGLGASKNFKFKPGSHRRGKATPLRLSPSCKSLVVIVPPKRISMFKPTGHNHGITRINANHGKRIRSMPLKMGRSAEEFIRMLSSGSVNRKFPRAELTSEENPIEIVMGLNEFDGHEGVDMDFEEGNFSFEEFRNA